MGNGISGSRPKVAVEERLTRPQRLARRPSDVDYRKLRRLILSKKLAPCFDALDEPCLPGDLEECPICYFYYPSLNRSRCCAKGICTECFLQMKPSDSIHQVQCPFCKTPYYAVEYRGARSDEEKDIEEAEEQRVIEAKIRMQNQTQNVEHDIPLGQTRSFFKVQSPFSNLRGPSCGDGGQTSDYRAFPLRESINANDCSISSTCSRHGPLDVALEEVMVMEAIWQSHQDSRLQNECNQTSGSSSTVNLGTGTYDANESGICWTSVDQTDIVSSDSLAEGVAISHANSDAYKKLLEKSDATGSEYKLASADSD